MTRWICKRLAASTALAVIAGVASLCPAGDDPGIPDTVRLESRYWIPYHDYETGDSIQIDVKLWNDEPLAALSIPLHYDSDHIEVTSIDIAGSAAHCDVWPMCQGSFRPDSNAFLFGWVDFLGTNPIPPTDDDVAGFLLTLNVRLLPGLGFGNMIEFDSMFFPPAAPLLLIADSSADYVSFVPQFVGCHLGVVAITAESELARLPATFSLHQNVPNPFNVSTIIEYALRRSYEVTLDIYDLLGRPVATQFDGLQPAGAHRVEWNGRGRDSRELASGVYFYRLTAGEYSECKKMLLLK